MLQKPSTNNPFDEQSRFDVGGNILQLVYKPDSRLNALVDLIERAQNTLRIFFYIFEDDDVGRLVLGKLIAACERGVDVELLIDSFGSNGAAKNFFDPLKQAGARFAFFSPRFSTSYFVRNHQKIVIADNRRLLIGGFNVANQYFEHLPGGKSKTRWADLGLVLEGPETERLGEYFDALSRWVNEENGNLRSLRKLVKIWDAGDGQFRWLLGGPSNRLSRWAWSIKNNLEDGQRLDMVSAYFSPGQGLLRRIAGLSLRGGVSRLLLAGKTDNAATIGASRLLYGYLLKRKAEIFEYQRQPLHMKLVIVDDAVYIGSANFDLRSLFINVEMMLRIEDPEFADHARNLIDQMCTDARKITHEIHRSRRGLLNRLRWALSYFVVNTIDYTFARRLNFGLQNNGEEE